MANQLSRQIRVTDPKGLYKQLAVDLVQQTRNYTGGIRAANDSRDVSAKSLGQLLSLSAKKDQVITFSAEDNTDAEAGLDQIISDIVQKGWGEVVVVAPIEINPADLERQITVLNPHGLHARPSTELTKIAKQFKGNVLVSGDNEKFVSAKSMSKLIALGAKHGDVLTFKAEPNEEASAAQATVVLDNIVAGFEDGLGEETKPVTAVSNKTDKEEVTWASFVTRKADEKVGGIPASAGMAIAPAFVKAAAKFEYERQATGTAGSEYNRLLSAVEQAKSDIQQVINETEITEVKQIFTAHLAILEDPSLVEDVKDKLNSNLSAPAAWHEHYEAAAKEQAALPDKLLAERAADIRDIGERVLGILCGVETAQEPSEPYILIKEEVTPSDVATLDKERVAGIMTAVGGASAHSAIVARALAIPAVVGAGVDVLNIKTNTTVIINGETGDFIIDPNAEQSNMAKNEIERQRNLKAVAQERSHEPAVTQDGHHVEIAANIGKIKEAADAVVDGAEAVGLLRTELVFMAHDHAPDEEEQTIIYTEMFEALEGRPMVVRTMDVGGDKPLPYLPIPHEENPFLGMRGIRLSLVKPELLRAQITALLKAADNKYPLRIMFPMVGQMKQWREAKAIVDEVREQYPCDDLQVGIMIEVPSAALMASTFAKEVDFFSIGTNDLTQYTMAIDRGHPVLSAEASGLHPSVLRLIDITVKSAHEHGKWVGICGELGADPVAVPVLVGLGVDELSMSSTGIPMVKAQIRDLNYEDTKLIAEQALECDSVQAVREMVKHELHA